MIGKCSLMYTGISIFLLLDNRKLVRCLLMTGSDLCTSAKPWPVHRESVKKVFAEFYQQVKR